MKTHTWGDLKRKRESMNQFTEAIERMSQYVAQYQNCVMELIINETTAIAHLIPLESWEQETRGEDEDEDY